MGITKPKTLESCSLQSTKSAPCGDSGTGSRVKAELCGQKKYVQVSSAKLVGPDVALDVRSDHLRLCAHAATSCTNTCRPQGGELFIHSRLCCVIYASWDAHRVVGLSFDTPSDTHERKLRKSLETRDGTLRVFGQERPLLLDLCKVQGFCEPGGGAAGDKPAPCAHYGVFGACVRLPPCRSAVHCAMRLQHRAGSIAATTGWQPCWVWKCKCSGGRVCDAHPVCTVATHDRTQ